ncbi:prepilin-type N-terminal cleavage/methylation domain-containing protein [Ruficoccus sp. ZRK36]|uniref:prepilin-type N-terminal cleavage/methylation domain-containing protein n=1 Tax=Ruficoccus sp. ZRK36 TaxID=2866311 RepID=UPI001C73DF5E|nr:prepilin-type N-terminal cleavage/methylation domain-containing protein [Ruficoccus sp. ZRK36]QYY37273.1 prepilin-type N-terminal cleavage/methylation domain-containing protein [Ruficoccus sp. ZRK36]
MKLESTPPAFTSTSQARGATPSGRPCSSTAWRRTMGFSLIELLACIATIAILAAILVPVLAQMRNRADTTGCAANLRQIGMGAAMYANDHQGTLPGPLRILQKATYNASDAGHLGHYLYLYWALPTPRGGRQWAPALYCPGYRRLDSDPDNVDVTPYRLATTGTLPNNRNGTPFGYTGNAGTATTYPYRLSAMNWEEHSKIPAVMDYDHTVDGVKTLSHGTFRNVLYFDWHVEQVEP